MFWAIFVPKTDDVTAVWSSLLVNWFINSNNQQMNETEEDNPRIQWVNGLCFWR
jgi:hypothetical protein